MATYRRVRIKSGEVVAVRHNIETASENPLSIHEVIINELLDKIDANKVLSLSYSDFNPYDLGSVAADRRRRKRTDR